VSANCKDKRVNGTDSPSQNELGWVKSLQKVGHDRFAWVTSAVTVERAGAGNSRAVGHVSDQRMTVVTFDTVEPADSVEFCPHPRAQDVFVCGTYKLLEGNVGDNVLAQAQRRRGKCLVFEASPNADGVVGM
jgi:hypothetical protein